MGLVVEHNLKPRKKRSNVMNVFIFINIRGVVMRFQTGSLLILL